MVCEGWTHDFKINTERLLAQDMITLGNGFDSLLCVNRSCTRNDNGIQVLLCEHIVVVLVYLDTFKILLSPCSLCGVRCAYGDNLRSLCEIMEVDRMAFTYICQNLNSANVDYWKLLTHSAKACDTDTELRTRHTEISDEGIRIGGVNGDNDVCLSFRN